MYFLFMEKKGMEYQIYLENFLMIMDILFLKKFLIILNQKIHF